MQLMTDEDGSGDEEEDGAPHGGASNLPSSSGADSDDSNESGEDAVPLELCVLHSLSLRIQCCPAVWHTSLLPTAIWLVTFVHGQDLSAMHPRRGKCACKSKQMDR